MNRSPYYFNPGRCVVCWEPAKSRFPSEDPVCERPECRRTLRLEPNAPSCRICHCRLRPAEQGRGVCQDPQCIVREGARVAETRRQAQLRRMHELIDEHVGDYATSRGLEADEVLSAVVPANDHALAPQDPARRERLAAHLEAQLSGAGKLLQDGGAPALVDAEDGPEHRRSLSVCAACWGGCCMTGAEHGYIKPETIARYVDRTGHPLASVVQRYLDRLPDTSYVGSCIFHGPVGCGLDREMRSDTCNQHLCGGLKRLQARMRGREGDAIVVIGSEKGRHVRTVVVAETDAP